MPCLGNPEQFLHEDSYPPLLKAGLAHAQFATIHHFQDGDGRMGRLLITFVLGHDQVPAKPLLYLRWLRNKSFFVRFCRPDGTCPALEPTRQ